MSKQTEITITMPLDELNEILQLANAIALPDVTYCDDLLPMAQQAVRLSQRRAQIIQGILFRYVH
ncbi:hypothetical protein LCGC14_3020230 [marine sediment metagenome]|uniref:Uncharacterized protein n=1 Tax=marine sediment metagenome TaxID=412755 RepID=A0A0F8XIE6_9ZZZZ